MPVSLIKTETDLCQNRASERGAALIATVAVIALLSVFLIVGLKLLDVETDIDRRVETRQTMHFALAQIASYTHRERRLPCPADPAAGPYGTPGFGIEDRTGGPPGSAGGCARTEGILPFQTLNMPENFARDRWSRYITYAISPVFGNTRSAAGDGEIFYICRRGSWVTDFVPTPLPAGPLPPADPRNTHILKARFCCPPAPLGAPATDLRILTRDAGGNLFQINLRPDQTAGPVAAGTNQRTSSTADIAFDAAGTLETEPVDPGFISGRNILAFAAVLVSHGPNGHGAFLGNGTAGRFTAGAGTDEDENADADTVYVDRAMVTADGSANYFDDIVLWRSQFGLYNELNNATCARPWR